MRLHIVLATVCVVGCMTFSLATAQDDFDDEDDFGIEDEFEEELEEESEIKIPQKERPVYVPPKAAGNVYFTDAFVSEEIFKKRWAHSEAKKDGADEEIAKYDGKWSVEEPTDNPLVNDLALVLKSKAKHHAIAAKLDKPYKFSGKPFIVQYEVKFQTGQECGGAYIKLLSDGSSLNLKNFQDKTPYTIMFGPDKCGNDDKLHFIFRHKNPLTGEFEEKHAKKPASAAFSSIFTDKKTHLFRLVINPDNTFEIFVDGDMINSGSLLEDVSPPVNPPKEIEDKNDKKPEDWDEREKIPDPEATKPEDWDEDAPEYVTDPDAAMPEGWLEDVAELIPDPDAERPKDWDDDMDGEWEAPMISNPACESAPGCGEWNAPQIKNPEYKGKWKAPKIDNPNYKGKWKPRMILNPDHFEDLEPYMMTTIKQFSVEGTVDDENVEEEGLAISLFLEMKRNHSIEFKKEGAVGLELWSMSNDIAFDNFIITDSKSVADQWTADTFDLKQTQELVDSSGQSVVDAVLDMTNERPWLWAVILVVFVLPVVLVIAYCCSGGQKIINQLLNAADKHKWLYAVYVAVVLLPSLALSVWLCPKGPLGAQQNKPDEAAARKKTDAPTPDDAKEPSGDKESSSEEDKKDSAENQTEEDKTGGGGDAQPKSTPKKSPRKSKKASKSDLDADDAEQADVEEDVDQEGTKPATRTSPRKRAGKARKD